MHKMFGFTYSQNLFFYLGGTIGRDVVKIGNDHMNRKWRTVRIAYTLTGFMISANKYGGNL